MKFGIFFTAVAGIAFFAMPATAVVANLTTPPAQELAQEQQVSYDDIVANLQAEGYTIVSVETTFLGRLRIVAQNGKYIREVIVSSSTGEVKRDVITGRVAADGPGNSGAKGLALGQGNGAPGQSGNAPGQGGSSPGNSGSANGNSNSGGSGNGNSGGNSGGGNGNGNSGGNNGNGNGKNN